MGNVFRLNRNTNTSPAGEDKPKSKCWINVGYKIGDGENERFVNLGQGIPLDNMKHFPTNSSNQEFAQFRSAQNGLLDQLREYIMTELEPGESAYLEDLVVEVRHAKDDQTIASDSNPFFRQVV